MHFFTSTLAAGQEKTTRESILFFLVRPQLDSTRHTMQYRFRDYSPFLHTQRDRTTIDLFYQVQKVRNLYIFAQEKKEQNSHGNLCNLPNILK